MVQNLRSILHIYASPPDTNMINTDLLFFNVTPTTEIYTLSLHDALPISPYRLLQTRVYRSFVPLTVDVWAEHQRSEEHTSELQSLTNIVCRLLLEKKKKCKK